MSFLDTKKMLKEHSKKCKYCKLGDMKCIKQNFAFSSTKQKNLIGGKVWHRPLVKSFRFLDDFTSRNTHCIRRPFTNVPVYSMYFYCEKCGNVEGNETLASDLQIINT